LEQFQTWILPSVRTSKSRGRVPGETWLTALYHTTAAYFIEHLLRAYDPYRRFTSTPRFRQRSLDYYTVGDLKNLIKTNTWILPLPNPPLENNRPNK